MSNLDLMAEDEDISAFFGEDVKDLRFPRTGRTSCFIDFKTVDGLRGALLKSGKPLLSRSVRVEVAAPRKEAAPRHDDFYGEPDTNVQVQRPKLDLEPRTVPEKAVAVPALADAYAEKPKASPFGSAKPVDLTKRLEERQRMEDERRKIRDAEYDAKRMEMSRDREGKKESMARKERSQNRSRVIDHERSTKMGLEEVGEALPRSPGKDAPAQPAAAHPAAAVRSAPAAKELKEEKPKDEASSNPYAGLTDESGDASA